MEVLSSHKVKNNYVFRAQQGSRLLVLNKKVSACICIETKYATKQYFLNSLALGRCDCYLRLVIFKLTSGIDILSFPCEIALWWMPQDHTDDQSTLVQVTAWCRQATSHYASQSWPIPMSLYGITRPQWVTRHGIGHAVHRYTYRQLTAIIRHFIEFDLMWIRTIYHYSDAHSLPAETCSPAMLSIND